ncbi:MAG: cbb3-type cytochrome oxidase assembly protein CcoS [Candidatus Kapabacteria bacterium]|nr:cbb3-type cytochrome oxidase assembly protein CcoS [Candidatus Kapabacteria bacterium]
MSVMILLVICSILVAGGFLVAFLFATKGGQYDDLGTPPVRMLFEDDVAKSNDNQ